MIARNIIKSVLRLRGGCQLKNILKQTNMICKMYPSVQPKGLTSQVNFFMSSQQQTSEDQELQQYIKQQKMKLKMDMEFQTSTMVEETCYGLYPLIIEEGTAQDALEFGKIMIDYSSKMEGKNVHQQSQIIHNLNVQVIRCYGYITIAFGHLKNDNTEWADQELSKVQKEFQSFESKLNHDQRFLIVSHVVRILSLAEKEDKCKFLVKYIINELQSAFKEPERLDENQMETAFKSIHFYILSLIQKKKDDVLKQLIEESQFLDIEYLYNNSLPIAYSSAGHIYSCIGFNYLQNGEKLTSYKYLKFAADLFEQIEGKSSPNYQYIQNQLEQFK